MTQVRSGSKKASVTVTPVCVTLPVFSTRKPKVTLLPTAPKTCPVLAVLTICSDGLSAGPATTAVAVSFSVPCG